MSNKIINWPLTAIIIFAVFAAGCSLIPASENEKILKVGVIGPFSGRASEVGEEFKGAVEIAFEQIDYKISDYRIELIWIDSQSDPKRATRAYEKVAVEDEIDVSIHNYHSAVAIAVMDVAARNRLPHFFGIGATEIINEKMAYDPEYYSYYIGKTWPSPEKLTGAYVETLEYAISKGTWEPRNNRVAIYGENTDWGRSFGTAISQDFEDAGWEIVGEEYFTTGAINLAPLMKTIHEMDVAVIAGSIATAPSLAAFIEQTSLTGLQSVVIADGLGWVGEWYNTTGDSSNYVLDQIPGYNSAKAEEFIANFEEKYGYQPSPSSGGLVFDKTNFFIKIAEETLDTYGTLNRETFYKYGREKVLTGETTYRNGIVMEEYKYTPLSAPDPVVGEGNFLFPVVQYFEGEGKILWPEVLKETDFTPPVY